MRVTLCIIWSIVLSTQALEGQFEGIVESKNLTTDETGARQEFTMTIMLRNNMARVDIPTVANNPGTTMIYRNDKRVVWMLNLDEKTFSEIPHVDEISPAPEMADKEKYVVLRSGKTKKILGYPCEQTFFRKGDEETEIWGTRSLIHVAKAIAKEFGDENPGEKGTWSNTLTEMGLFPLMSTSKVEGTIVESQVVTRVEQKQLSLEKFEIPPGFTKENVGKMWEKIQKSEKR